MESTLERSADISVLMYLGIILVHYWVILAGTIKAEDEFATCGCGKLRGSQCCCLISNAERKHFRASCSVIMLPDLVKASNDEHHQPSKYVPL